MTIINQDELNEFAGRFLTDLGAATHCRPVQRGRAVLPARVPGQPAGDLRPRRFTSFRRATETPVNRVFEVRP
jgi:hypothetical protein